ncbi:MAG: FAD-binding protein [Acidobacteria bacterium]|nr:FAD-binding protein [Acidobacteriota bacterium]
MAAAHAFDPDALRRALTTRVAGEIRFDAVSRALYSTDASVYQIQPAGVAIPRTRDDLAAILDACREAGCPITMRGGGTSQAGQAIGRGLIVDTSKYLNRVLDVHPEERWARVEPGVVLDELNAALKPHGLRFAPDVSTASRATIGGMMANNSSGARSILYGKTIDHVLEQDVLLSDGSVVRARAWTDDEARAACAGESVLARGCRLLRQLGREHAAEIDRRFPNVLRRVGGYNLDAFVPGRPFDLTKLMVGSEGTLGIVLEARLGLVPLPAAKAVLSVQFDSLLDSLEATPLILRHRPSAVEVMDRFILDHTKKSPALDALRRSFVEGDPASLLCVELYADRAADLPPMLDALEADLRAAGWGSHVHRALAADAQARIWSLREAALGLSMAMKTDEKAISFVEDTAVPPERLRDYIARFLEIVRRHGTTAGIYAHASVGCLHVRPVIDLKTADGVSRFEAIAREVAELVLEFGGALSGEHGDGLVRSPFMRRMYGPVLYDAFESIKRTFDPAGLFNPGKIVDAEPLTANLRYGAGYETPRPATRFDYSAYGGMAGAVEMCSGLGACRKTLDGTMCPSFMATREEMHSTRGRANALRLAMAGRLGEAGLGDEGMYRTLDWCLECRACKAECPVGVDVARFKSEFLADYWTRHAMPRRARLLAEVHALGRIGSRLAPVSNWIAGAPLVRQARALALGIDGRRRLPRFARRRLEDRLPAVEHADAVIFADTFSNYYDPDVGLAAAAVLEAGGLRVGLAGNVCCGRPKISKGLLRDAAALAAANTDRLHRHAAAGRPIVFCEPSCLSAVREDAPDLLRGDLARKAREVAEACVPFEQLAGNLADRLRFRPGPAAILLHAHCHQKSMGLAGPTHALLARLPGSTVTDTHAGCCGMAGSFGYEHVELSRAIADHRLLPAIRARAPGTVIVATGTSCRQQVADLTGETAVHPAVLVASCLEARG